MRLLIAMMKHETNTFSPVPTPLARLVRAALWRGGDPRLSRHRHRARRLSRSRRARTSRDRLADRRRRLAERPGRGRRLQAHYRHDLRGGGARRVRRHHARSARRDGHREPGGWRGRVPEAAARDRPQDADRRLARHARQSLRRDDRQCDRRHRLSHLPAYRHLRDRQARRRDPVARDPRRGEAGHGVAQRADAAACHAPGHRRSSEQGIAAPLRRDERRGCAWPRASSPASRMPTSPMPG